VNGEYAVDLSQRRHDPSSFPKLFSHNVCRSCNMRLIDDDRLDGNIRLFDEIIETPGCDGVATGVDYNS
jgi:hypothetical protein